MSSSTKPKDASHKYSCEKTSKDNEAELLTKCVYLHSDPKDKKYEIPKELKANLYPHQVEGYQWMINREIHDIKDQPYGGIIADDCGLGKTMQIIALMLHKHDIPYDGENSLQKSDCTLIICPVTVMYHWKHEIKQWTNDGALTVYIHHGTDRRMDIKTLSAEYNVIVTTYGTIRSDVEYGSFDELILFKRIILDDAHEIKNRNTKTHKAVCALSAKSYWYVTATPILNELNDLYAALHFLKSKYMDYKDWKKQIANNKEIKCIRNLLNHIMLRRLKSHCIYTNDHQENDVDDEKQLHDDVDDEKQLFDDANILIKLPNKIYINYCIAFGEYERRVYDKLSSMIGDRIINDSFECPLLLRQSCSHLVLSKRNTQTEININDLLPVDEDMIPSAKLKKLMEILKDLHKSEPKAKCVIFSQWPSMLDIVEKEMKSKGYTDCDYCRLDGKTKAEKRCKIMEKLKSDPKCWIMLASLKVCGVGLNLQSANHVFMLDIWWNQTVEDQAIDRVHRIGQTKDVTIHRIIIKDSVEQKLLKLQKPKRKITHDVLEIVLEINNTKNRCNDRLNRQDMVNDDHTDDDDDDNSVVKDMLSQTGDAAGIDQ